MLNLTKKIFRCFKMTNDFFKFEDKEFDLPFLNGDSRFTTKNVVILLDF